jgi:hypothetical protein
MRLELSKLSHAYKEMRERTTKQAEGKEPPSLGSGGPSHAAVRLTGKDRYGVSV